MKQPTKAGIFGNASVAPFTGAWIETAFSTYNWITFPVAPFTGAWIET